MSSPIWMFCLVNSFIHAMMVSPAFSKLPSTLLTVRSIHTTH
jgi:hypothetical protein